MSDYRTITGLNLTHEQVERGIMFEKMWGGSFLWQIQAKPSVYGL